VSIAGRGKQRRAAQSRAAAIPARSAVAQAEERDQKVALQKKIQDAVLTGKGWEGVPPAEREERTRRGFRVC
jgi:hypothetical protein